MKWNIIADSSCDLDSDTITEDISLSVVPMKIIIDGEEHSDDGNIDIVDMMRRIHMKKSVSGSSCPSPYEFAELFKKGENNICVCISSALSGTYASALAAKTMVEEDGKKNILVIDTKSTSGKMQLIINEAIRLIKLGLSFEEISNKLDDYTKNCHLVFTLSCFENLIKNGRMPRIAGLIAGALGIRPVAIANENGQISVIAKPKGFNAAVNKITAHMEKLKDLDGIPVIISHCNNFEGAKILKEAILNNFNPKEVIITNMRALCSYYADEKGIILAF